MLLSEKRGDLLRREKELKQMGQFTVQELWIIEGLALYAIAEDNENLSNTDDERQKSMLRHEIEMLKLLIEKCYWQQGKEADHSWDKYLPEINK